MKQKKRIEEGLFSEPDNLFTIKLIFFNIGVYHRNFEAKTKIYFIADDNVRDLLGFNATKNFEKCHLSPNPAGITSFDNIFLETENRLRKYRKTS